MRIFFCDPPASWLLLETRCEIGRLDSLDLSCGVFLFAGLGRDWVDVCVFAVFSSLALVGR